MSAHCDTDILSDIAAYNATIGTAYGAADECTDSSTFSRTKRTPLARAYFHPYVAAIWKTKWRTYGCTYGSTIRDANRQSSFCHPHECAFWPAVCGAVWQALVTANDAAIWSA